MKLKLRKDEDILDCLNAISAFLVREKDGFNAVVSSGSLYVTLRDRSGNADKDDSEYEIDEHLNVIRSGSLSAKAAGNTDTSEIRAVVRERLTSDLVKAERQLERDRKAERHASNMLLSSKTYNRKPETVKSWHIEADEKKKALMCTRADVRDLKLLLKAIEDENARSDLHVHRSTFSKGFYKDKAGVVVLLEAAGDKGLLYSYKGLQRISLKRFRLDDYRDRLILIGGSE